MKKLIGGAALAVALVALAGPQSLAAAGCDVSYRLWQDGKNTYYKPGETIFLDQGEKAHLYIHGPSSQSADPYSASADFGAPTDFGVGGQRPQDINRFLRLGDRDPRKGKIEFETIAPGETALAYRITDVVRPGRLDQIPANCRTGQVRVTVRRAGASAPPAAPPAPPAPPVPGIQSTGEAAHELITRLYTGILRRSTSEAIEYPNEWHDRVQRAGLRGLIFIAETMTVSPEFREMALSRSRQAGASAEDQLLSDISRSLYGSSRLDDTLYRQMAGKLRTCLSSGQPEICRQLGRDLVSQRQYYENNRTLLDHWRNR